jgi:CTP:molybdopterin cytidylyltransferase MocA
MIPGVILAAGLATRMGRSKALLDAGGVTFMERVSQALSGGGCDPVFAVVRDLQGKDANEARRLGLDVVLNPDPAEGPITSLRAAIRALPPEAEAIVFCHVDHPKITGSTVETILSAFRVGPAMAVVPTYRGKRGHPTLLHRELFPELMEESLPHGARTVLHRHSEAVEEVQVEDAGILVDVDTEEEYLRYLNE